MSDKENLIIDYKSIIPVYEQIKQHIKVNILNGNNLADEKITSVRELSRLIKVNQNTIVKAYYQLEQEGFIYSKPGRGYFVKENQGNQKNERQDIFLYATKEYLEKITAMGFSVNDVIAEMEKLR
ncbi:MAG: GntR family transcriptional regulator [Spirochaetaceae bacterium]|jgi:GntR family transcriptional regulator|nr:GntR family transcriptional regulator [Spirochaetaceae bacterium]